MSRATRRRCCPCWAGSTSTLTAICAAALEMFSASAHLPHDPWTTRLRVMLALSRHRFDEALEWMQSALLVDPYAPSLHASLAWTYHLAGQSSGVSPRSRSVCPCFPDDESSHLYGAIILAFNGQAERAARHAEEFVRRTPYFDMAIAIQAYVLACAANAMKRMDSWSGSSG